MGSLAGMVPVVPVYSHGSLQEGDRRVGVRGGKVTTEAEVNGKGGRKT